jgi:hypothetical protein
MALYQNGSSGATSTATASSLMSQPITILAQNDNGTIDHFSAMQIALGSIGGSMTSTQVSNIYSACTAICPPSARRVGADMAPATEMRSAGAANARAHGGSVTLISRRHRVVTQAMLSSHRRMRVILASPQSWFCGPKRFCTSALGASSSLSVCRVVRSRRRAARYWPAIPTRWTTHAADCVFTQLRASKPALNFWTSSIVPSGHSASTSQCSPSLEQRKISVCASARVQPCWTA